jgi:2-polyprenyl-6-methoxyphenol hydroxylase-like FAD-dependent oxidoreductase
MADANAYLPLSKSGDFRVIIIGGSISGLTLALALERCGIDYLLLEKTKIAPAQGQSIFLVPCSSLVLDQLGVGEAARKDAFPLRFRNHRDEKMKVFCLSDDMKRLGEK